MRPTPRLSELPARIVAPVATVGHAPPRPGFILEALECRTLLAAAFHAPAEVAGAVDVQLVPLGGVTAGVQEIVTFGLPFTRGSVTQSQLAQVRVLRGGVEIPAFVEQLTPWRSLDDPALDGQSVRVARIQIPYTFATLAPETITVQWGGPTRTLNITVLQNPRLEWHSVISGSFVAGDGVEEPDVLPVLPAAYLSKGMLDARTDPTAAGVAETRDDPAVMDLAVFTGYTEYDYAQKNFFYTLINQNGGTTIDYKTQYEPWLYDRSSAMYELYFRSGFATALREAVRATDFYFDHLSSSGYFTLKTPDSKYSYNEPLAYTYWLLGDDAMLSRIPAVVSAHSGTATRWTPQRSFWTERGNGLKLLANVIAYEVTGEAAYKSTVQTIVDDLVYLQNGANGQLPLNRVDGGLYHYGWQHDASEVGDPNVIIASPWMSALIVDAMVRVHGVWENDARIPDFLVRMGRFEAVASKWSAGQFGGVMRFPDYLMRSDGTSEARSSSDAQHAMDVGGIAAWATYFAERRGTPDASLRQLAYDLYATYDLGVNYWTSSTSFTVNPPRRYAWEYKNSASFSWALTGADPAGLAGTLQFGSATYDVVEGQPAATITVTRTGGSAGAVSVQYATGGGTATAASDYTAVSGTLAFADGQTSRTFTVPILDDSTVENAETVLLTLSNPTGGAALAGPATATLTIDSDDTTATPVTATFRQGANGYAGTTDGHVSTQGGANGTIGFTGTQINVYQLTGTGGYTTQGLLRFGDLGITTHAATDATVTSAELTLTAAFGSTASVIRGYYVLPAWTTAPGTDLGWLHTGSGTDWAVAGIAGAGTDVVAGKSFLLPSVTGTQTVTVALDPAVVQSWINDPNANQGILLVNETMNVVVRVNASENATAGTRPTLSVSYTVGPGTHPGALEFSSALYSANENQPTATITVTRTGGSEGAVSVDYVTAAGTATAGIDYTPVSGTLSFADGETSKTFTIPLLDDALVEADETVVLTLRNPTGGAILGSPTTAGLIIVSDDGAQPGSLQFSNGGYTVNETDGVATITVTRTGGSNVAVSVNYATGAGTATPGNDYTPVAGTLNFAIGETSKTFTIPLLDDALVESNETVSLALSSPTGGATLGSPATATLTIVSDDVGNTVSATYQQGVNGYTGTTDVAITSQGGVNTNFTGTYVRVYTGGTYATEALMRFGDLGVPAGATINSATLTLTISAWSTPVIRAYYVLAAWDGTPQTPATQVGWIHRGTAQDWNTPGALGQGSDVIAGKNFVLAGITGSGVQTRTFSLDSTVVQGWIDNPASNQGLLFVCETTTGLYNDLYTSDHATVAYRPLLTLNYTVASPATVAGRGVFYNNSVLDGYDPAANAADDAAIAADKSLLLPGQASSPANYVAYYRGINGLMVDIAGLGAALTADDFVFRVGTSGDPATWAAAPAPAGVTVRPGAGAGGSDRVTIVWADNAIRSTWLHVTVLSDAHGGHAALEADDVFCIASMPADFNGDGSVNISDLTLLANVYGQAVTPGAAGDANADGLADLADLTLMANYYGQTLGGLTLTATGDEPVLIVGSADLAAPAAVTDEAPLILPGQPPADVAALAPRTVTGQPSAALTAPAPLTVTGQPPAALTAPAPLTVTSQPPADVTGESFLVVASPAVFLAGAWPSSAAFDTSPTIGTFGTSPSGTTAGASPTAGTSPRRAIVRPRRRSLTAPKRLARLGGGAGG